MALAQLALRGCPSGDDRSRRRLVVPGQVGDGNGPGLSHVCVRGVGRAMARLPAVMVHGARVGWTATECGGPVLLYFLKPRATLLVGLCFNSRKRGEAAGFEKIRGVLFFSGQLDEFSPSGEY